MDTVSVVIEETECQVDIEWIDPAEGRCRQPLTQQLGGRLQPSHLMTPEEFEPARDISNVHDKPNRPGMGYCHSTNSLLPCESRLEMWALTLLDFEGDIESIASQPFTLHFRPNRKPTAHTPDFFYRTHSGEGVVVDVKGSEFLEQAQMQFRASREACEATGWTYRVITTPPPAMRENISLLAGYRTAPPTYEQYLTEIYTILADGPLDWDYLTAALEDVTGAHPVFIPTLLLHGIWAHHLYVDLTEPLTARSRVAMTDWHFTIKPYSFIERTAV